ncbi:MAG TPA: copper-containing nitrite reductase [Terriglobales bacterium]|nr:copper-containing nitrite reductase [Terriglobales bacterium]
MKTRNSSSFSLTAVVLMLAFAAAIPASAQMSGMSHTSAAAAPAPMVDIVRDPAEVPPPVGNRAPTTVRVTLNAVEVVGELDPSTHTAYRYWTFDGKLPGPMIRVRQGDTVEVTLHNDARSHMVHSADFHAALGPGGGAAYSQALPGQEKHFSFVATTPGLFVYHCGTPMIADHIANGMYGLILVEPPGGMTRVDREFYVMQGEIYTVAAKGKSGLQAFSEAKLSQEAPEYFVFNGAVDALTTRHPLHANTGETVRIFFGDAGPNATSSIHVVGEIFTHEYEDGSLTSPPLNGVQTASVPAGGAAILELKTIQPGNFNFMDHAMARMAKGLMGTIQVKGEQVADLMRGDPADVQARGDHDPASPPFGGAPAAQPMMMSMPVPASQIAPVAHSVAREVADSATQAAGCLTFANGVPTLAVFHSHKSYRLDPKAGLLVESPLAFGGNIDALVQVKGRRDGDAFVVSDVEQLAPACDSKLSLTQLKAQAIARAARARAAANSDSAAATVGMGDMSFSQPEIVINAGQSVTWKNSSAVTHNVVTDAAKATNPADVKIPGGAQAFDSGYLQPGQLFSHRFTVPGVYKYVCTLHESGGMKATVIVKPASGAEQQMAKR